ncbi:hypothetical protein LSAT2_016365 [Lamellibrachia satsuma]|nr:hypothetical protein LSAT2_016365 [Lamellibrachia satsuma]
MCQCHSGSDSCHYNSSGKVSSGNNGNDSCNYDSSGKVSSGKVNSGGNGNDSCDYDTSGKVSSGNDGNGNDSCDYDSSGKVSSGNDGNGNDSCGNDLFTPSLVSSTSPRRSELVVVHQSAEIFPEAYDLVVKLCACAGSDHSKMASTRTLAV